MIVAAYVCSFAQFVGRGLVFPVFLRIRFKVSLIEYLWLSIVKPLACNLHLAMALQLSRQLVLDGHYWIAAGMVGVAGIISVAFFLAFYTDRARSSLTNKDAEDLSGIVLINGK